MQAVSANVDQLTGHRVNLGIRRFTHGLVAAACPSSMGWLCAVVPHSPKGSPMTDVHDATRATHSSPAGVDRRTALRGGIAALAALGPLQALSARTAGAAP